MKTKTSHTKADIKTSPRCSDCQWVHESDSVAGTSFMGVALCPNHAAAPQLVEAMQSAVDIIRESFGDEPGCESDCHAVRLLEAALKSAGVEI